MFEIIKDNKDESIVAVVLGNSFKREGIEFFTPPEFSQQLGYMNRPKGYKIKAHAHKLILRQIVMTQETILVKSGKIKVDLFDNKKDFIKSVILSEGDVILLASGGHGFEFLENSELIEIKQGPYASLELDKEHFGKSSNE